jgi:hypothetical protein
MNTAADVGAINARNERLVAAVKLANPTHRLDRHLSMDALVCKDCGALITGEQILASPVTVTLERCR